MRSLVAYLAGALFAVGLVVGGMTQPSKIVDFLDFTGNWDPSLAFVMGGALLVNVLAYRWTHDSNQPLLDGRFHVPDRNDIDWRLVGGSTLFGIGWGVSGFCPGPALTASITGKGPVLATLGGIAGGVVLYGVFDAARRGARNPSSQSTDLEVQADA